MSYLRKLVAGYDQAARMSLVLLIGFAPINLGLPILKLAKIEDPSLAFWVLAGIGLCCLVVSPVLIPWLTRQFGISFAATGSEKDRASTN